MIWIGVGSNMGDRLAHISDAMELLGTKGVKVLRTSSIYETAPLGFKADTQFLNAVFECEATFTAAEVLEIIAGIEGKLGRTRSSDERYLSRTIDLDILLFGNHVITTEKLTVPHPRIAERRFVLEPLNELIPNALHPVINRTIDRIYSDCTDQNRAVIHHKPLAVGQ